MSEQVFYALALAGLMVVSSGCLSSKPVPMATNAPPAAVETREAPQEKEVATAPPAPAAAPARVEEAPGEPLEGGAGGPDEGEEPVEPVIRERIVDRLAAVRAAPARCEDRCGDGRCQEAPCDGGACACEESPLSCPADCDPSPAGTVPDGP